MAKDYPAYGDLTKKQKKLALAKWHERKDAKDPAKRREAFLAEEVAPGLTRGQLRQDTRTAAQLRFGQEQRQLNRLPGRVDDWFGQYQQTIRDAQAAQQGNYQGAIQGVKDLQAGLTQTAKDAWAGQQAEMAADAARRGATVDPELADVAHNAANVRAAQLAGFAAQLTGQGANENAYLSRRDVNAEVGRVGALRQVASQQRDLAREKGAFKSEYRSNARGEAIKNYLNQVAAESLIQDRLADNERDKTADRINDANADATRKGTQGRWANSLNKYGYTNAQWRNMSPAEQKAARDKAEKDKGSEKDDKWGTQSQQNTAKDKIDYAVSAAKRLKAAGYTRSEAATVLLAGRGSQTVDGTKVPGIDKVNKDFASVGLDIAYDQHISARNVKVLRGRGIKVKPLGYPLKVPASSAVPGVGATGSAGVG